MKRLSLEYELESRGYTCLFCVGHGQRPDGTYSIKLAATPVLRSLTEENWRVTREVIIRAMDRMRESPLDDLEIKTQ